MSKKTNIKYFRKIWYFLWYDNSIWSYIINIILAFIIIKFILFPFLGFCLNTTHPLVAVVSGSMEHKVTKLILNGYEFYYICDNKLDSKKQIDFDEYWSLCGSWYEERNITKQEFRTFPFVNGFNQGDVMIVKGVDAEDIRIGDIIVFMYYHYQNGKYYKMPIIHRVVDKHTLDGKIYFTTKGDHNPFSTDIDKNIEGVYIRPYNKTRKTLIGKAVFRIPYLGMFKLLLNKIIQF